MKKIILFIGLVLVGALLVSVHPAQALPVAGVLGITNTPLGNPTATNEPTQTPIPPTNTPAPTATQVREEQPEDPTSTPTAAWLPHTGSLALSAKEWDTLNAERQLTVTPNPQVFSISAPSIRLNYGVERVAYTSGDWPVEDLNYRVGWMDGSAWPGDPGNVILFGHLTLAQGRYGPFVSIPRLKPGDAIVITSEGMLHTYIVDNQQIVEDSDMSITSQNGRARLTLITCEQNSWAGQQIGYTKRLVVNAHWVKTEPLQ